MHLWLCFVFKCRYSPCLLLVRKHLYNDSMERFHRQVKASAQSEDLKSWSSFSLLLFCFCKRKGLCRLSSHPRSPEMRPCFHFFLLLDVIDHPKREKGAVDVQCSSWAALESSCCVGGVFFSEDFLFDWILFWFLFFF